MAWWQYALIAFAIAWVLQAFGVWRQTRHYQSVFAEVRGRWSDGTLGVGAAPAKFGKGVIAMLVADSSRIVRDARVMQGRSVFATFKTRSDLEGVALADLKAMAESGGFERGVGAAILKAIEQIEKVEAKAGGSAGAAADAALSAA